MKKIPSDFAFPIGLLEALYDAASDDTQWTDTLDRLARWMDSFAALYLVVDKKTPVKKIESIYQTSYSIADQIAYLEYYHTIDPHKSMILKSANQSWFIFQQHLKEDFVKNDRFYQDYLLPHGGRWVIGARLWETDEAVAMMMFDRPATHRPFDEDDRSLLISIGPHLSRATMLQHRLKKRDFESHIGMTALHMLNFGMMVVDENALIIISNTKTEKNLSFSEIFKINSRRHLVLVDSSRQSEFLNAISHATNHKSSALTLTDKSGKNRFQAFFIPIPALPALPRMPPKSLAMIICTEVKSCKQMPTHYLQQLFELTPAEAKLANGLLSGSPLDEYSLLHQISVETTRKHLASLLAKTGTRRQAELVALLGKMPDIIFR